MGFSFVDLLQDFFFLQWGIFMRKQLIAGMIIDLSGLVFLLTLLPWPDPGNFPLILSAKRVSQALAQGTVTVNKQILPGINMHCNRFAERFLESSLNRT